MMQHELNCFVNPINRDRFLALILMPKLSATTDSE